MESRKVMTPVEWWKMALQLEMINLLIERKEHEIVKSNLSDLYSCPEHLFLHCSAERGHEAILKYLLDRGWNVNAQDSLGRTPLMMAIIGSHTEAVKILLAAKADIDILNNENKSALHMAFDQHCMMDILQLLFHELRCKKTSSSEETAEILIRAKCQLYQAATTQDAKIIKYMLERGSSVRSRHPRTKCTALHLAVIFEDLASIEMLLKYGADINALDCQGLSPLFFLCKHLSTHTNNPKSTQILRSFLNNSSPVPCQATNDFRQIEAALVACDREIVSMLLHSKLAHIIKDETNNRTLLHYLAKNRNLEVIEELKVHIKNWNVNALDRVGESPLYWAVKERNLNMVEFLLDQGAETNFANYISGATAIFRALNYGKRNPEFEQCAELLLQHNADPQVIYTNENGKELTVFNAAVKANDLSRMYSTIAHLAMLEQLGTSITNVIRSKINSRRSFAVHFKKCQRILTKEIFEDVTIFKLLTEDSKKIARYLDDKKFVLKLKRISCKPNARLSYPYYYNTLKKRLTKVAHRQKLTHKAAPVICKLFEDRLDADNIIVRRIIELLDNQDLRQLWEL